MGKTYSRVQRGMVFWFNPSEAYGDDLTYIAYNGRSYESHVQGNNRPWLVVSNNEGNNTAPTCNIVPITTEDKNQIPSHVNFTYEGRVQTILCEQVRTVDSMALKSFMYQLHDSIMIKVERALQVQFHIRGEIGYTDITLDNVIDHLEKIVGAIIEHQAKEFKAQAEAVRVVNIPDSKLEEAAVNLGIKIEELLGIPSTFVPVENPQDAMKPKVVGEEPVKEEKPQSQPLNNTKITAGMSQVEKFNAQFGKTPTQAPTQKKDEPVVEADTKKKRNRWTEESRRQYLDDCDKLSPAEVMEKYNFKTIQTVFQTKYLCKNALGIVD